MGLRRFSVSWRKWLSVVGARGGLLAVAGIAVVVALGVQAAAADTRTSRDRVVNTPDAPAAIGPYSQGIKANRMLFVSGQLPLDPRTGELVGTDITTQTERAMRNVEAVVKAGGMRLEDVTMATVYLHDLDDFAEFNDAYAKFFDSRAAPARATIQVARVPRDALVEISVVAVG